jgi:hypothetical protein
MMARPFWITAGIAALLIIGVAIYAVRGPAILLDLDAAGRLLCL